MSQSERLDQLLPEIYRIRDIPAGEPLRTLLGVCETELRTIEADIGALYDNWFIETCDDWVVPYIADLLGVETGSPVAPLLGSQRSVVGRATHYRRWKGTLETLRDVVQDATGWRAVAVEGFRRLAVTHSIRHPDTERGGTVDVRQICTPVGGDYRHQYLATIDDRDLSEGCPESNRAGYSLGELSLLVSRLQRFPDRRGTARRIRAGCYTFNPFGLDTPLVDDAWPGTSPPSPLHRVERGGRRSGRGEVHHATFTVSVADDLQGEATPVPENEIVVGDLSDWRLPSFGGDARARPIVVNLARGRLAFPTGEAPGRVDVGYDYTFSADLGGGVYDRWATLTQPGDELWCATVGSARDQTDAKVQRFETLGLALAAWTQSNRSGLIRIGDSRTYGLELDQTGSGQFTIKIAGGHSLAIEAANDECPCIVGHVVATGDQPNARLRLNGLWIDGTVAVGGSLDLELEVTARFGQRRLSQVSEVQATTSQN